MRPWKAVAAAVGRLARRVTTLLRPTTQGKKESPSGAEASQLPATLEGEGLTFVLDSLFLRTCRRTLTGGPAEELYLVTGVKVDGGMLVPCCLLPMEYEHASPTGVAAKFLSSHEQLRRLARHGHVLHLVVHAHPGTGPDSVQESAVDIAAQDRLERAGYPAISGIFSKDGYVKFFANNTAFRIRIYGSGIKEVRHHVYQINNPCGGVPVQTPGS